MKTTDKDIIKSIENKERLRGQAWARTVTAVAAYGNYLHEQADKATAFFEAAPPELIDMLDEHLGDAVADKEDIEFAEAVLELMIETRDVEDEGSKSAPRLSPQQERIFLAGVLAAPMIERSSIKMLTGRALTEFQVSDWASKISETMPALVESAFNMPDTDNGERRTSIVAIFFNAYMRKELERQAQVST